MWNQREFNIQLLTYNEKNIYLMKRNIYRIYCIREFDFCDRLYFTQREYACRKMEGRGLCKPFKATMEETQVSPDESYTLRLHDTGIFSLTTDCNTISGEYSIDGQSLRFNNLSATELACEKEIVERSFKSQLPMVKSYNFPNDTSLCLLGREDNVLVKLVKIKN